MKQNGTPRYFRLIRDDMPFADESYALTQHEKYNLIINVKNPLTRTRLLYNIIDVHVQLLDEVGLLVATLRNEEVVEYKEWMALDQFNKITKHKENKPLKVPQITTDFLTAIAHDDDETEILITHKPKHKDNKAYTITDGIRVDGEMSRQTLTRAIKLIASTLPCPDNKDAYVKIANRGSKHSEIESTYRIPASALIEYVMFAIEKIDMMALNATDPKAIIETERAKIIADVSTIKDLIA